MEIKEYEITNEDVVIGGEKTEETNEEMKDEEQIFTPEETSEAVLTGEDREFVVQENQHSEDDENVRDKPIGVYAKYDENGNVKEVNSDIFITDFAGWTKIDEGYGDRYAHAQSQYFEQEPDKM